jgi:CheY-like chemotaxis protein
MMNERPKVLAVDDSATIRKAMELVLDPAEYELELAASGSEAVAKAIEFQPQVILLDFILPDMRGADVCQKLSEDPTTAGIPVVLISAKGAEIRQAYDNIPSVVSYITKPFTPAGVTSVIDEAIAATRAAAAEVEAERAAPPVPLDAAPVEAVAASNGAPVEAADEDDYEAEWDVGDEALAPQAAMGLPAGVGRAGLEAMFETLRSSLEGVFVEESDTRSGAAADEAMSYHELAARLERQVRETLAQTESGARYNLCDDGSIRSLDDSLLDAYRRFCRVLFRAARDGAMENELVGHNQPRVLFVCARHGELIERMKSIAQERRDEWVSAMVASDYRQLPLMTRIFGPTHMVVEAVPGSALWDQLELLRKLPEGRKLHVIGVAVESGGGRRADGQSDRELFAEHDVETVLGAGAALPQSLAEVVAPMAARALPGSEPAPRDETELAAVSPMTH